MGLFISIEGGEGSGKTEQAITLADRLRGQGYVVIPVHEPGTTQLGQYLREWLKSNRPLSHGTELLLFAAARSELVATVVKPNIAQPNTIILADRYADSTTAYQGYGRQLKLQYVKVINDLATQGVWPDLTILLDVDPEIALKRLAPLQRRMDVEGETTQEEGRLDEEGRRRFEEENMQFHKRVGAGYRKLAKEEPRRWFVADASLPIEHVADVIWKRVSELLASSSSSPRAEPLLRWKT